MWLTSRESLGSLLRIRGVRTVNHGSMKKELSMNRVVAELQVLLATRRSARNGRNQVAQARPITVLQPVLGQRPRRIKQLAGLGSSPGGL
jgi:hypothetical protein